MGLRSLKLKIILSSAVCILAVGIFSNVYLYHYLSGIIAEKADSVALANLEAVQARVNQKLMRFHSLGYTCANDLSIARVLRYTSLHTLSQKSDGVKAQEKLWGLLEASSARDHITMLMVFNEHDILIQPGNAKRQGSHSDLGRIRQLPQFLTFSQSNALWSLQAARSIASGEDCYIYLSPVYDLASLSNRGWLYMEISPAWIQEEAVSSAGDHFYIAHDNGTVLPFTANSSLRKALQQAAGSTELQVGELTYRIRSVPLVIPGLRLMNCSDVTFLNQDGPPIFFTAVVVIATSLSVTIMLSVILSNRITHPLRRLTNHIAKISNNDLSCDPAIEEGHDEISQTGQMVNQMVRSIRELLTETERMHLQQKNSEIALLQSQVNPHFLYNTLDSIHFMATIQKNQGIMTMTRSLSSLLKNVAKGIGDKISLEEELSLVGNYIDIQLIRYMEAFQIEYRVSPQFYSYKIIKFTLQPLVENAIFHGIEPKGEFGIITIDAAPDGDDLLITVADDGIGMSKEELYRLQKSPANKNRSGLSGIGVSNVDERLKLVYGQGYGLTIESEKGRFTKVTVRIPKEV